MYIHNLVDHKDVPRYRRISLVNANFKQKLAPLKHQEELFRVLGFSKQGTQWEWHKTPTEEQFHVLRVALRGIEMLQKENDWTDIENELRIQTAQPSQDPLPQRDVAVEQDLDTFMSSLKKSELPYPKTFAQVAQMVQDGQAVPGMEHIEEKVSLSPPTAARTPPVPKPWTP